MMIVTQTKIPMKTDQLTRIEQKRPCRILVYDNYNSNKVIIFLPFKSTLISSVYFSTSFDRQTLIQITRERRKNNIHAYHPHS
jgi:hypothetical protein